MHYGNLQKIRDGKRTFGITPDIPSGFIQPETLMWQKNTKPY